MDHVRVFHEGIKEAVQKFRRNPFDFLYERDLQSLLFCELLNAYKGAPIHMKGGYYPDKKVYGGLDGINTAPVKCEYPTTERFDIAIIDPDPQALRTFDPEVWAANRLKNDAFWNQPLCAAAELKYCQLGDSQARRWNQVKGDLKKLGGYPERRKKEDRLFFGPGWKEEDRRFLGVSILFVQSRSESALTSFLNRIKCEIKYEEISEQPVSGVALCLVSHKEPRMFQVNAPGFPDT